MMARFHLRAVALVACLLSGAVAQAVPVIYDFAGTGSFCTYESGICSSTYSGGFTGTVSIDVLASGPSGTDAITDGVTQATDENGWVQSDFLIQWGSNSFNPGPVPSQTMTRQSAAVYNTSSFDRLLNRELYERVDPTGYHISYAELDRRTSDTSWLNDLSFSTRGLAPSFPGSTNYIHFADLVSDTSAGYSGFAGTIALSSLTARTTSVPEPGTLALFGLGLAGLPFTRRRRKTNG